MTQVWNVYLIVIKMFKIYNLSSENMHEVLNESVDLIVTSPPYNIGTKYLDYGDNLSFDIYKNLLIKVLKECSRVLKKDGKIVIEIADSILINKQYVSLAALFVSLCIKDNLSLTERHINFINTKKGIEIPDHSLDSNFTNKNNAHSNCHQWIIFSKGKHKFNSKIGKIFYLNYYSKKMHPCPFNKNHFLILDMHFKNGMTVLDPFMGTANLGIEILKRGGNFYGYEIVKDYYEIAQTKLKSIKQQ